MNASHGIWAFSRKCARVLKLSGARARSFLCGFIFSFIAWIFSATFVVVIVGVVLVVTGVCALNLLVINAIYLANDLTFL